MVRSAEQLKSEILKLTREYSALVHKGNRPGPNKDPSEFIAGETVIPYAGRVFTEDEVEAAVESTLNFWLTLGKEGELMERELAQFLGIKKCLLVNSGSSANLVAFSTLTSHKLPPERRIQSGDEVITCAAGFPTTITPIVQNGAVPVFIDNDPMTGNARTQMLEEAFVPGKTKAVMMAHALGNPFNLSEVLEFCHKYGLWLIEDNCDALGSTYTLPNNHSAISTFKNDKGIVANCEISLTKWTGTFGAISTQSFYPPHHLTMGEGGAVNIVRDLKLNVYAKSIRDWGRDCWCPSGVDNTCNRRFGWKLGLLPEGYDHKYIYSHLGYNLKPLDFQAAIGRYQLQKLPSFIKARKENWEYLRRGLAQLEEFFDFSLPTHATAWTPDGFIWDASGARTDCSWFGFLLHVKTSAPFTRNDLARYLDAQKIGNRMLFGGNLVRQPAFIQLKKDNSQAYRIIGQLEGADQIMNQALFIGTYPGLTHSMMDYEIEMVRRFVQKY